MEASSSASPLPRSLDLPAWKNIASHLGAVIVAFLFLIAGIYKAVDPYKFASLATQLLVPVSLSLPLALGLGIAETTAGALILVPRFRRWGAMLSSGLLLAFMGYIGWNYAALLGQDCSCFPDLNLLGLKISMQRSVGPGFFWGDAAFLLAAAVAGFWGKPTAGFRTATVLAGAVAVFSSVSFGVAYADHNLGIQAPPSIVVDGQPVSLEKGRFFLFFYNPACTHCQAAALTMGKLKFKDDLKVIAIPTGEQQWAQAFLDDAKFVAAKTSLEVEKLREVFKFEYPPYGFLIEEGHQTGVLPQYDENGEPEATLRKLGMIE